MGRCSTTGDEVLTLLEDSGVLNRIGEIRMISVYRKFNKLMAYQTFRTHFRKVMDTMQFQGKAKQSGDGTWMIIKPNER